MKPALLTLLLAVSLAANAEDIVLPVKLTKAQIAGGLYDEVETSTNELEWAGGINTTEGAEAFVSDDSRMRMGLFRSDAVTIDRTTPRALNEYMHFIEGGARFTAPDGSVFDVTAGESILVPRGWVGLFETDGYLKLYVAYAPE